MDTEKACGNGHALTPDNVRYYTRQGQEKWQCRRCDADRHRKAYHANLENERARCREKARRRRAGQAA